jgi:hypothetical protein
MEYHYLRAYIVEGTSVRDSQEILLYEDTAAGVKFVLSSQPDPYLTQADKAAAIPLRALWTIEGQPEPPPAQPLGILTEQVRFARKKATNDRMVLICQFTSTANQLPLHGRAELEGTSFCFLDNSAVQKIIARHNSAIDRAIAGLFVATPNVIGFMLLTECFSFIAPDGSQTLANFTSGSVSCTTRRPFDPNLVDEMRNDFARYYLSEANLKTVSKLLSDSLLSDNNKLRRFLAAWTCLEVFIKKFGKRPKPANIATQQGSSQIPHLVRLFESAALKLGLEHLEAELVSFKRVKKVRDDFIHGEQVDVEFFPTEEIRSLIHSLLARVE